jgi:Transposase Tn5 dimerisation domain
VEIDHDVEKNGCSEEQRRFETAERMETAVAVLAVVAVRVLQLRLALDAQPEAPAEQVASAAEVGVLRRWLHHAQKRFTVADFVRAVARLGGFLGRTGDGPPGVRSLWRGYQRLQDRVLGFHLHDRSAFDSS